MNLITLNLFVSTDSIIVLLDVDECAEKTDNCHEKAKCTNNEGSFFCSCNRGYTGNGIYCYGTLI